MCIRDSDIGQAVIHEALALGMLVELTDEMKSSTLLTDLLLCLLYTSDAADERSSVDLGGRRIIKKKTKLTVLYTSHRS